MPRISGRAKATALSIAFCFASMVSRADKVRILENPVDASQARVDLIQQAKHSIDAQYYIVGDDYYTLAGLALLRDAARRGCKVRLLIDAQSNKVPPAVQAHLRQEGVIVKIYHPFRVDKLLWVFRRMHDKGLNVDHQRMIRGGRNIEGSYYGYEKRNFIDRDVYVEGESTREAADYFDELWNSSEVALVRVKTGAAEIEEGRKSLDAARSRLQKGKIVKLNTGRDWSAGAREVARVEFLHDPVGKKEKAPGIAQELRKKLRQVRHSVLIETPYLIPTKELLVDLEDARRAGVKKIELITNSLASNDSMMVQLGYEVAKKDLQKRGARLWEFKGPDTLHSKSAVLDDRLALIGSFNIDPRSQHLNTETAVAIYDEAIARQLAGYINAHKKACVEITDETMEASNEALQKMALGTRMKMSVLKALMPLIRGQL